MKGPEIAFPCAACKEEVVAASCLGGVQDGESDVQGMTWHVHVRDRLPIDLLRLVPSALKHLKGTLGSGCSCGCSCGCS